MAGVVSKRQQARNEKALYDLVQNVPGNNACADCQTRNPGENLPPTAVELDEFELTAFCYSLGIMERTCDRLLSPMGLRSMILEASSGRVP